MNFIQTQQQQFISIIPKSSTTTTTFQNFDLLKSDSKRFFFTTPNLSMSNKQKRHAQEQILESKEENENEENNDEEAENEEEDKNETAKKEVRLDLHLKQFKIKRDKAKELILASKVTVNGVVVTKPAKSIKPTDVVKVLD